MTTEQPDPKSLTPAPAESPAESGGPSPPALPEVIEKVDREQLKHFVTTIKSAERQVGEHIIGALQHDDTVAVLTTVVVGPDGSQNVVSAGLDPAMMHEVQKTLAAAEAERREEVPCIGFHCYLEPKTKDTP